MAREVIGKKEAEIEELRRGASFTPLEELIEESEESPSSSSRPPSNTQALDEQTSNAILAQARLQASRDGMSSLLKTEVLEMKSKLKQQAEALVEKESHMKVFREKVTNLEKYISEMKRGEQRKVDLMESEGAEMKLTYLKGAVLKYMCTASDEHQKREALLRVISSILLFNPAEVMAAQHAIDEDSSPSLAGWGASLMSTYDSYTAASPTPTVNNPINYGATRPPPRDLSQSFQNSSP